MYNYWRGLKQVIEHFDGVYVQDITAEMVIEYRNLLKLQMGSQNSVSYTHLDVYKRQAVNIVLQEQIWKLWQSI